MFEEEIRTEKTEETEEIDPMKLFTPNEAFDAIQLYDSSIEIIGYVDGIESPRLIGDKSQYKFFKFYLNNGTGKRIQVVAWNEDIDHIEHDILSNNIIHLDGVQARIPKNSKYNKGNIPFELLIRNNTVISILGRYEPMNNTNIEPKKCNLSEVLCTSERVKLEGYIKMNFTATHNAKLNKIIGYGAITDGVYKLEVHIPNFDEDDYINLNLKKGDKIEFIASVYSTANPPYLVINNLHEIKQIDGFMPLYLLLKGVHLPKKRQLDETSSQQEQKKFSACTK